MRVAFNILSSNAKGSVVELFNATDMDEQPKPLTVLWDVEAGAVQLPTFQTKTLDVWQRRLMAFVLRVMDAHGTTPLTLVRAFHGLGGKQVIWDVGQGRYRNLSTAQEGAKVWQLVGTKLTVEGKDEKDALSKAPICLMNAMKAKPAEAPALAAWYEKSKVKEVAGAKLPDAIAIAKLAHGEAEVKLAETAIPKLNMKDDDAAE